MDREALRAELGFQRGFWGYMAHPLFFELGQRTGGRGRVFFNRTNYDSYRMYRREGAFPRSIHYANDAKGARVGVHFEQRGGGVPDRLEIGVRGESTTRTETGEDGRDAPRCVAVGDRGRYAGEIQRARGATVEGDQAVGRQGGGGPEVDGRGARPDSIGRERLESEQSTRRVHRRRQDDPVGEIGRAHV